MTNDALIQTYVDLLIIQYSDPNNQPKAMATISLQAGTAVAQQIVGQVGNGYSITTLYGQTLAQGVQLNVLGQFVGAERTLPGYNPASVYFGMQDTTGAYSAAIGGYADVTGAAPTDYWNSTNQTTGSYTLSDAEMVQLILYLAAANNAYMSLSVVDEILFEFFGTYVTVSESAVMQVTYTQNGSDPGTLYGIVKFLVAFPQPAGVQLVTSP